MELLEEYALNDDDLDFWDGTNISEDTAGPNSVSDVRRPYVVDGFEWD